MKMQWVDAPPAPTRRGRMFSFVQELIKNPNRWAVYPGKAKTVTSLSKNRKNYPEIEWVGRTDPDGKVTVYARFVPPPSVSSEEIEVSSES